LTFPLQYSPERILIYLPPNQIDCSCFKWLFGRSPGCFEEPNLFNHLQQQISDELTAKISGRTRTDPDSKYPDLPRPYDTPDGTKSCAYRSIQTDKIDH